MDQMTKKRVTENTVTDQLVELVVRRLSWRATLRARSIRVEARAAWQDKKKNAQLKFRASQFEDLSVMLKELTEPEQPVTVNLKLGSTESDDL
jgi:hypothetical protein